MINGQTQQPWADGGMMTTGPDPSDRRVWDLPPDEHGISRAAAWGERNLARTLGKGDGEHQLQLQDQG